MSENSWWEMFVPKSSLIKKVDYCPETYEMEVTLTNGMIYRYSGVPCKEFYDFSEANSKGAYFNYKIKSYKCKKVL